MKHIVCIIDGTWLNAAADTPHYGYSNAYNLNYLLETADRKGNPQIIIYLSGLGSDNLSQPFTAGAFARGIDHQIREAYINICSNYRTGDKIYLFGFSRGAVAVRAVSGLISKVGLLKANQIRLYDKAWLDYLDRLPGTNEDQGRVHDLLTKFAIPASIEFLGAFDAVLGNRNQQSPYRELNFTDLNLSSRVKTAVHLLALDECRKFYHPLYWRGLADPATQTLEQIWMPGVHSDVGGVYKQDALGKIALRTMIDRIASHTDLSFDNAAITTHFKPGNIHVNNERVGVWRASWKWPRKYDASVPHQWLHPVCSRIGPLLASYKNSRKRAQSYSIPATFRQSGLSEFPNFDPSIAWDGLFH